MFIAYTAVAVIVSLVLIASARAKLIREPGLVKSMTSVGIPVSWFNYLAACEIAGALGLLVGLVFAPLGIAAATGVVLYFIGALITHLRARDFKGMGLPFGMLAAAVAALVLRIVTA